MFTREVVSGLKTESQIGQVILNVLGHSESLAPNETESAKM